MGYPKPRQPLYITGKFAVRKVIVFHWVNACFLKKFYLIFPFFPL